jgi:putative phosphoribosyl transferase
MMFNDRRQAGKALARRLVAYSNRPNVLVLALPRGGVPVAYEVAKALGAPLDVFVVRKLGFPGHEELAMGAIASGGIRVLNELVEEMGVSEAAIEAVTTRELRELERREQLYRGGRRPPDVRDRTVILVDDGLATGSTMRVAATALRLQKPAEVVVAVPVASAAACQDLATEVDEVVCVSTPEPFYGVGMWYADFAQTSDAEVYDLLERADRMRGTPVRFL